MKKRTAEILTHICNIVGPLAFLLLLGIVGSIEQDMVTLRTGMIRAGIALAVFGVSVELGNYTDHISHDRG